MSRPLRDSGTFHDYLYNRLDYQVICYGSTMLRSWLWRIVLAAGAMLLAVGAAGVTRTPARADTYTSYLVAQLRANPVYISAYVDDATPADASEIARLLSRVPLKAYVIDDTMAGPDGEPLPDDFAAVLHDQLGGQLYILDRGGAGSTSATAFGTSLPVADAMQAATFELNGDPSLSQVVQRFVAILRSGKTEQALAASGAQVQRDSSPPGTSVWAVAGATAGGTAVSAGLLLLRVLRRRRKRHPRFRPDTFQLSAAVGLVGLLGGAIAAHSAVPASGPPTSAADGVGVVATSLTPTSPLYLDPEMTWLFTAAQVKQITATLKASPVPIYVIAVPFDSDEDFPDYESYFLDQLYGRTHRNGTYLIIGPRGDIFDAEYQVPRDISLPINTELGPDSAVTPAQIAASTPGRLLSLIKLVDASAVDSQAAGMPTPEYSTGEFPEGQPLADLPATLSWPAPSPAPVITGGILGFVLIGPLLTLFGLGGIRRGRRLRARRRGWGDIYGDPGRPVERMPAAPHDEWLRRHALGELAELGRMIAEGRDGTADWARGRDDYDAGMLATGGEKTGADASQIDLVGAITLARDGRMALKWGIDDPPPPCLVNPLHGAAATDVSPDHALRTPVLQDLHRARSGAPVPVCPRCAELANEARLKTYGGFTTGGVPGQQLRDRLLRVSHDGKRQRYDEFASVWRDQAFGAAGPGLSQAVREHRRRR